MEEWGIAVYIDLDLDSKWFEYRASVVVKGERPPRVEGFLNPHSYTHTSMTQEEAEAMVKLLNASQTQ